MSKSFVSIVTGGDSKYKKALSAAWIELSKLDAKADVIARRRAQLQQTISTLQTLTNVSEQEERSLTDSIRIIVKAASGYVSAADVMNAAYAMGAKFSGKDPRASVITILGRLVKEGELEREPGTIKVRFRAKPRTQN
jgi:ABC-type transporter Mla subunit MlaD